MAPVTIDKKPAAATIRGGLNLVFSSTHPSRKDRVDVHYHIDGLDV